MLGGPVLYALQLFQPLAQHIDVPKHTVMFGCGCGDCLVRSCVSLTVAALRGLVVCGVAWW